MLAALGAVVFVSLIITGDAITSVMTETNVIDRGGGEGRRWLLKTWHQAHNLRHQGVPVIGYTWYSLTDQVDWDIQLREIRGRVNANGLVTLDGP